MFVQTKAGVLNADPVMLEGYVNAKLLSEVIKLCGHHLTQICLLEKFRSFKGDLGGMWIDYTQGVNQGINKVYFNIFSYQASSRQN